MKKILTVIAVFLITLSLGALIDSVLSKSDFISSRTLNHKTNLVIDAGHGGRDGGTIGVDGNNEKDINLSIAKNLNDFALVCGYSSKLVRDGDYLVYKIGESRDHSDLYSRLELINSVHNATMISIHQNHFENQTEWGMQVWYSPNDDKSKILADNILNTTKEFLQKDNKRENKKSGSDYYILYNAKHPSVMVECGFMSNPEENKRLQDTTYQSQVAYSIFIGFCNYTTKEL